MNWTDEILGRLKDHRGRISHLEQIDKPLVYDTFGWLKAYETWTYASADDPTFTFTISGDQTSKYSAGMRIRLTQTTVKYFIITKVGYSDPNTTITVYGGTNYNLVNAAITLPGYSSHKAPCGFPLDPLLWTVESSLTADAQQLNPTGSTWYNLGTFTISVPIGSWNVDYQVVGRISQAAATTGLSFKVTLSKINNASDDNELIAADFASGASAVNWGFYSFYNRSKFITRTAKTTYYLLAWTYHPAVDSIMFRGGTFGDATIRATCAYL